jgi:ERCC4-type nuclease
MPTDRGTHVENLLSCLEDMRATLQTLTTTFEERTAKIKSGDTLEDIVAELEGVGTAAYDELASEAKGHKLLLQIEKDDLMNEINSSRDLFLRRLYGVYATLKEPNKAKS